MVTNFFCFLLQPDSWSIFSAEAYRNGCQAAEAETYALSRWLAWQKALPES